MRTHVTLALSAILAALVLAAAAEAASANRFSISGHTIRDVWSPITFSDEGSVLISCNLTVEGSLHSATMAKTLGTLTGLMTRASVSRPCRGGTAWLYNGSETNEVLGGTLSNSLPWHLSYQGFEGALPNITGVKLSSSGARFLLRTTVLGIAVLCNYTIGAGGNPETIATARVSAGGAITGLKMDESINFESENRGCPKGKFSGEATVTQLGSSTALTISLI